MSRKDPPSSGKKAEIPPAGQAGAGSPKRIAFTAVVVVVFVLLSSLPTVRGWLAAPLVENDGNARGDACYVFAAGGALWERLAAAADLVQMGRVPRIILMRDDAMGPYSFKDRRNLSRTGWAMDYLAWRGVPPGRIVLMPQAAGLFGTLTEAGALARVLPAKVKRLVVVSSAPHMRRAMLAVSRSLPGDVQVIPYAATSFKQSYEMFAPIWLEYLKLAVYAVVA